VTRRVRFTPLLAAGVFCGAAAIAQAGQVPFEARPAVATSLFGPIDVLPIDIDHDGDLDLVASTTSVGNLLVFANVAGDGSAWAVNTAASLPFGAMALAVADVDGDGDVDLLSSPGASGVPQWFENVDGQGTVWSASHFIGTELYSGSFLSVGDVDRDGDQDVVTVGSNSRVLWYENAGGTGLAWVKHTVSAVTALQPSSATFADVDGDGDLDVVSAALGGDGAWFENTAGNGSAWTARTLGVGQIPDQAVPADVDGDGDLDLLLRLPFAAAAAWLENVAGNGTSWTLRTIATGVPGPVPSGRTVTAADVDRDGDLDVLVSLHTDGTVAWYENLAGDGTQWAKRTIVTDANAGTSAAAADLDGDGDPDVARVSLADNGTLVWHRNATVHESACFVPQHVISTAASGAQSIVPADVDGDGDLDAVSTAFLGNTVAWHENFGGSAATWVVRTISATFNQAARVAVGDVDRDGDVDVAAIQGTFANGALAWFDNTAGNGSAWTQRTVSTAFGRATHVELVDLSGDGDLDLLGAGYYTSPTRWFENATGNGLTWTPGTLPTSVQTGVATGDIDGDGDPDVASTESFFGDGPGWTENTAGNGSAWANHTVATPSGVTYAMATADIDGDGDLDVLQPGLYTLLSFTAWHENVGGSGASWAQHAIPGSDGSVIATAHDLDRDGDQDVVQTGSDHGLRWFENTAGNGLAWATRTLSDAAGTPGGLSVADLDGDGDPDVLSATAITNTLAWHENQPGQASIAAVSQAPASAGNSAVVSMLRATVTHLGRPGDGPVELASLGLRFEESPGDPLTTVEANALVESLRVYRDANGTGVFEPATDVLVTSVGTLSLTNGVQSVTFTDGDANLQVVVGTPRTYFVVVELTANASTQVPNQLMVTLLETGGPASVVEDGTFDLPLRLACPADVSSAIKQAVPVELMGFAVE
jgi:hypothetical protein